MSLSITRHDDGALVIAVNARTVYLNAEEAEELTKRLALPLITSAISRATGLEL